MKVKVIRLGKKDAFYKQRKELIGLTGEWKDIVGRRNDGWYGGTLTFDNPPVGSGWKGFKGLCFAYVKFEVLEK